jgi:hypothetical protein
MQYYILYKKGFIIMFRLYTFQILLLYIYFNLSFRNLIKKSNLR